MTTDPQSTITRKSAWFSSTRITLIVYLLTAFAIWWWYPGSPRLVINAGPQASFAGFTPDGNKLLTSTNGGSWKLWDVHTGKSGPDMLADRYGEPIGFSSDGTRFYAGPHYYSTETGERMPGKRYLHATWNPVGTTRINVESADGLNVAQAISQEMIVADAKTGEERFKIPKVTAANFTSDSRSLFVAITDNTTPTETAINAPRWTLKRYDSGSGQEREVIARGDGTVTHLAITADQAKTVLAVWQQPDKHSEMGLQLWNVSTGKREQMLTIPQSDFGSLSGLHLVNEGHVVTTNAVLGAGGFIWDLSLPLPDGLIGKTGPGIFPPLVSEDGKLTAFLDPSSNEVKVRRLGVGRPEIVFQRGYSYSQNQSALPLAITSDGRLVLQVSHVNRGTFADKYLPRKQSRCEVFEAFSGKWLGRVPQSNDTYVAGISPDGHTLVTQATKPELRGRFTVWDVPTLTPWLAIIGGALVPAAILGGILCQRKQRNNNSRSTAAVAD